MKQRCLFISLLTLMVSVFQLMPVQAQNQFAIYNYRNDGDFNAWLDIDVEKITYSCTDLDGVEHDDIVVQEVWTPDSVYRIPISAIDSIGFRAPKPEMKEGIFHITEDHLPYAVSVEDLTVTFRSSIPTSLLPSIGQVVISDVYDEPFEIGFAGRVKNVVNSNGTIIVICEEVGLGDVYDQLIYVGKTNAYEDDADYSKASRAPRKIKIYDNGVIDVPLGKFSLKVSDGSDASVSLSAKPSLTVDYLVAYNVKGVQNQFKVVAKPKVEYGLDYKIKVKKSKSLEDYLAFIPIETGVPGLRIKVRFGAFLDLEGSVSLDGNMTYTTETTCGFDSNIDENHGFFYSVDSGWEDPEVSLELEGSLFCGPVVQVSAYVIYEKGFPCVKFNLKPGVEFSGKIVASSDGISEYGFNAYDMLKDSKLSLGGKLKAESSASVFGKKFDLLGYSLSPDWLRFDFLLFPKFTKPEIKNNSNFTPTSLYSEVSGQTLFTTNVGMAVYDEYENPVSEDISIYNYVEKPTTTYVSHNMVDYSSGKYLVRPLVKNIFGTFPASPVAEFTVPEPVSLETTTITVQKDKAQNVAINGGWGDYSVIVLDKSVCTAELKQEGDSYYIQIVGKKDGGSTSVTLKDLRSQKTAAVLVSVTNEVVQKLIKVEPKEIDFGQVEVGSSKSATFTVSNVGTASLTVTVASGLDEGDDCVLSGSGQQFTLAVGQSKTFTLTYTPTKENAGFNAIVRILSDAENDTEIVTVSGRSYKATVDPVGTETITVNGVSFTMVGVDGGTFWMGSADDDGDADSDERPRHQVTLSSFAIGQTEVTQELWEAVMGSNPSNFKGGSLPVECVSWNDCQEFLTKLNALTGRSFRLPTEAEWEYAARGGSLSRGYKYSGSDDIGAVAWYGDNSGSTTHAVGTKAPNELGLYDMSGNVWEWCQDWYNSSYFSNSPSTNPCNDSSASCRVYRGGSWDLNAWYCRVARRNSRYTPGFRYCHLGLRLAH